MTEEQKYWSGLIDELQAMGVTLERIAEALGVNDRQVSRWKAGTRPTGWTALKLVRFHMEQKTRLTVRAMVAT